MADSYKFVVPPPFDASADSPGDCLLKTPEGVQFKVHRSHLMTASPVFRDMFDMPQPNHSSDPLPVIELPESPETLHALLVIIYPIGVPVISTPEAAFAVATACDKYFIDAERLRLIFRGLRIFDSPKFLSKRGIMMYALAWKLGMEDEAKTAARYTHAVDINNEVIANKLITLSGSLKALLALEALRLRREEELDLLVEALRLRKRICMPCGGPSNANPATLHCRGNTDGEIKFRTFRAQVKTVIKRAYQQPFPFPGPLHGNVSALLGSFPGKPFCCIDLLSGFDFKYLDQLMASYPQTIKGFT